MEIDLAGTVSGTSFGSPGGHREPPRSTARWWFASSAATPHPSGRPSVSWTSGTRTGTFSNVDINSQPYSEDVVITYDAHGATLTSLCTRLPPATVSDSWGAICGTGKSAGDLL